jgi:hypothetical protein
MIEEFKPPNSFIFNRAKVVYVGDSDIAPDSKKMNRKMHVYKYETGHKKGQKEYFSKGNIGFYISQEKQEL